MKIKRIRTLNYPNVYSYQSTLVLVLEIDKHDEQAFSENSDFISLLEKSCAAEGSGEGRLREIRTSENALAAAVKNVALGLISAAGFGASAGAVRFSGDAGIYEIAVGFQAEEATRFLLKTAVEAVAAALRKQGFLIAEAVSQAREIAARNEPSPLIRAIVKAAESRLIPCSIDEDSIIQLGYGKNLCRLRAGENSAGIELLSPTDAEIAGFFQADKSEKFGETIIETLYPDGKNARIPIVAITGTNGKTTVTRLIAHVLRATGLNIGTTTTDGILLNGEIIEKGDTTGPASAQAILNNGQVDIAVLETARGGILRRGLGWDLAEIAIITNITEDHIGQDAIESVADLVDIKSLIAERVAEGGTLILNADDAESAALIDRPAVNPAKKKIVFFGMSANNPLIKKHRKSGETAYFVNDGWICEGTGGEIAQIAETLKIPIAMNGTADFQIQNALAASAAARALSLSPEKIAEGLYSFQNTVHNPGRNNILQGRQRLRPCRLRA